ncbi:butyrophilin subfamily 1 member A1-like [Acanthopagrus latus]|uniref:butyrophilin subfamily 1 member A1-like n=1 Tax=Acanthopagrus latus TaxID=8177 RepID=UPI00187C609A|nr:butyrophilin subfamily 1 member A1-like [Acanthopagrus latus]
MLRATLSGSLNFQCGAFTVLVVLIHSCRGQHHVIGPSQPILATVGEDIILPAYLEPATNAKTIEWTRPDLSPRYVHVQRQGVKLTDNHPSYEGRTSLLGNISLKLSRVRISDEGPYRCFLPEMKISCIIQLVVGAASSPDVQMTVVLQCNSTGWYPEPEVFWLDGEGNLLSAGPTETVRGPDDLYTVSSRVTVEKRHSNSFTCRVQQNHINQIREAHIHVPDLSGSSSPLPVIIGLILGIVFVLAVQAAIFGVWKWRQNRTRSNTRGAENEGPEAEYEVREESTDLVIIAGETEHGTETELINKAREAPKPTDSDQKNKEDESESVIDVTEKLMEGETEDNLQKEGGEQESEGGCRIS